MYRERGTPPDATDVIARALRDSAARVGGRLVAAQDVAAIVLGGAVTTITRARGTVECRRVPCKREWVSRHIVWGHDPHGDGHRVPDLLQGLLSHPQAAGFILRISRLAMQVSGGLRCGDLTRVAGAVNAYRKVFFEEWGEGRLLHPRVAELAREMGRDLGGSLLAWKPPGAGSASSLIAVTTEPARVVDHLHAAGWEAFPAALSPGLRMCERGGAIHLSAPQRIDLVGGADLGQNLGVEGRCCGLTVEPRNRATLRAVERRAA